jgi:hypothetical protein
MLAKVFRSSVAMRAAAYKPAYSASATKEQTTGMRVEWQEMGWLTQSSSSVSPRELRPPATLPALGRERKEASDRSLSGVNGLVGRHGWMVGWRDG